MEAAAEHDFCFPRLIGMFRAIECAQIDCATCQAGTMDEPFGIQIILGNCFVITCFDLVIQTSDVSKIICPSLP